MLFSSPLLWELHGVSVVLLNCNTIVILLKAFSFSSLCTSPLTVAPDLVFRQLQCFIFSASTPDIVFVALECFLFLFPSLGPSVIVLFSNCNTRHSDPLEGFLFLFSLQEDHSRELYFSNCGTRLSISATSMLSLLCFNTRYSICCS